MQIFKKNTHIDFMGKRKLAMYFSILLMLISLGAIVLRGLSLGIDFTGGTLIEVGYQEAAELSKVREVLQSGGFGDATVQHFGTSKDVLVRLSPQAELQGAQLSDRAFAALKQADAGEATLRRVERIDYFSIKEIQRNKKR